MLAHNVGAASLCPDFQLIRRGGPEGVACNQQHLFASVHLLLGQLSDGGGLPHTVDTDDQHHAGMGGKVQLGIPHTDHIRQNVLQGLLGLVRLGDVPLPDDPAQPVRCLGGSFHTQVRQDQALFQIVVKIVVNLRAAGEKIAPGIAEGIPSLGEPSFDFFKKSHFLLLFL